MAAAFPDRPPPALGLAVSGGGDSMALLQLAAEWADGGVRLAVATVNHGLRPEAADEAAMVARAAAALGLPHETLSWAGGPRGGNLQAEARAARQALLAGWAQRRGIGHVATGHTADDQAETVLMRLARGSGVDGLAAIRPVAEAAGIVWLRPLLSVGRGELRDFLAARGLAWADDPSNDDDRYDRVKARRLAGQLARLGLTRGRLVALAGHMQAAREVLDAAADDFVARHVRRHGGDLLIDRAALAAAPRETRDRVVAQAVMWISGAPYRPRHEALAAMIAAGRGVLGGCLMRPEPENLRLTREYRAVRDRVADPAELWDDRWRLEGPAPAGSHVAALGETGLGLCPGWRATGFPRASLVASPALWQGKALVAAPLARPDGTFALVLARDRAGFGHAKITD